MVQAAVLLAAIGMAVFFLLILASIILMKSALGGEESGEPVEQEVETCERSERSRQRSSA